MSNRTLEEEIEARRRAMAELDQGSDGLIGDHRRSLARRAGGEEARREWTDRHADQHEDEVFGEDELEQAAFIQAKFKTADGLAAKTMLRQQKWEGMADVAKFVRINPPSALHGTIGGQQVVISGGPALQVANWGGEDAECLPLTVTFAPVQQISQGSASKGVRPFGIVKFGTRGFLVQAEVDIGKGTQFVVGASQCTLQVALEEITSAGSENQMKLAGMLSFYPVIRTTPVTRTKYIDFIAAIAVNVVVPAFAKNVSVWRGGVSTVALTLDFKDTAGNVLYTFLLAAGSSMTDPIPLSDDVASIDVTKTAGADNAFDVRLIFELSF